MANASCNTQQQHIAASGWPVVIQTAVIQTRDSIGRRKRCCTKLGGYSSAGTLAPSRLQFRQMRSEGPGLESRCARELPSKLTNQTESDNSDSSARRIRIGRQEEQSHTHTHTHTHILFKKDIEYAHCPQHTAVAHSSQHNTHTDTQTHRQTHRHTDRQTDRHRQNDVI